MLADPGVVEVLPLAKFQLTVVPAGLELSVNVTGNGAHPAAVFALKLTTGNGLIVIVVVEAPPQPPGKLYVMVLLPTCAADGSNEPVDPFTIPLPDQVPPGLAAVKVTMASFAQKGPAGLIAVEAPEFIASVVEAVPEQPLSVI